MTTAPKISIITINYNNAVGLQQTMDSVLAQSYQNIDYIVIDGASTDGSVAVIEKFSEKLSYWISEKDKGIYNAMNKGIEASKGDYLLFLNSGDRLHDDDVIANVQRIGLTADLTYGHLLMFNEEKQWTWLQPNELSFQTMYESTIPHPSTFIKKSLFDQVGYFDEELKIVADWKFFLLALAKYHCSYQLLDTIITIYNFDGLSSKPENLPTIEAERQLVLTANFKFFINDYEKLLQQQKELKKINYFLKTRKFIRKILNQK